MRQFFGSGVALAMLAFFAAGCGTTGGSGDDPAVAAVDETTPDEATPAPGDPAAAYRRDGFVVEIEDGRLWALREGQEKSEKHVTWVGAGPDGMTLKAVDRDTALAYLATRPGFRVEIEDGRIWVLRDGQEKSEKHITRVGAGPRGATVKAVDQETLQAYLSGS